MDATGVTFSILLLVVLILCNAFFAMSEIAIISIHENKMKKRAESGHKKAKLLLHITDSPSDFLATIQVGVTLSGFLASAVAAERFAGLFVSYLSFLPISLDLLHGIVLIVITLILSYFTLIFGELVPKRVALQYPDKIALSVVTVIWVFYRCAKPFVSLLAASTNGILKLFSIHTDDEEQITEEEILLLVEEGEEKGVIEHREKTMIQNIFEFDDKKVSEVMTHRTEMVTAPAHATVKEIVDITEKEGYSRIPIYQKDFDNIIGVIYIKDLLPLISQGHNDTLSIDNHLRSIPFVPETKRCSLLLKQFQEEKIHIAIVVDEHGGTEGLVTMEDLLEVIVGDIEDEHDDEGEDIVALSEGVFIFDAATLIEDVEEYLKCNVFAGDDYDTIGGFMIHTLGRIPRENEKISTPFNEYTLTVLKADSRRIFKIQVEKNQTTMGKAKQDN